MEGGRTKTRQKIIQKLIWTHRFRDWSQLKENKKKELYVNTYFFLELFDNWLNVKWLMANFCQSKLI